MEDIHQKTEELYIVTARLKATIARRGDIIAKKQGYPNLNGMDAVHRYLIDRHHWLPDQVRGLSVDDLQMLLDDV